VAIVGAFIFQKARPDRQCRSGEVEGANLKPTDKLKGKILIEEKSRKTLFGIYILRLLVRYRKH